MMMPIALAGLDTIMTAIGIPLDIYIILIIGIGTIILSAKTIKTGLSMSLLLFSLTYALFRVLGMDTTYALYAILIAVILMALSLYTTRGEKIV